MSFNERLLRHYLYPSKAERIKKRFRDWTFRLTAQMVKSYGVAFVTLTYRDEDHPECVEDMVDDVKNFFKRLRRGLDYASYQKYRDMFERLPNETVAKFRERVIKHLRADGMIPQYKYFLVSEFGDSIEHSGRAHYHLILFGFNPGLGSRTLLEHVWQKGFVDVKPLNPKRIKYVCKYMFKQSFDSTTFVRRSMRIGFAFFNDKIVRYLVDNNTHEVHINGLSYSVPSDLWRRFCYEPLDDEREDTLRKQKAVNDYFQARIDMVCERYHDHKISLSDIPDELFSDFCWWSSHNLDYPINPTLKEALRCAILHKKFEDKKYFEMVTQHKIK